MERAGLAAPISDIRYQTSSENCYKRKKKGQYILMIRSIHQEAITSINIYISNKKVSKYMKQK